jgi:hypothetical protein
MIIHFDNPCPSGVLKTSYFNKNKVTYDTQFGENVINPYDGVITTVKSDKVVIKHVVNSEDWESEIKNFRPNVAVKQRIFQGRPIGITIDGTLSFEVTPDVDVKELITIGINSSKVHGKKVSDDDDDDDDENSRSEKYVSKDDPLKGILKMFLSPVTFAQGALGLNKKDGLNESTLEEKTQLIKEDIDRMKKLF